MSCTCGHAREEHGHDPKHPGSTACTECDDCIAYEEEDSPEDDDCCLAMTVPAKEDWLHFEDGTRINREGLR